MNRRYRARYAALVVPIGLAVVHRLATVAGWVPATSGLLLLATATFGVLVMVGLVLGRLRLPLTLVGLALATLFWLSGPDTAIPDWTGGSTMSADSVPLGPGTRHRDLIVLMVDDYPSSEALLVDHGYDNEEFRLRSSEHGLEILPEAWSNSSHPLLAIATTLSGRMPLEPDREYNEWDRRRLMAILNGVNPVAELLRDNGYRATNLGGPTASAIWFGGTGAGGSSTTEVVAEMAKTMADDRPDFVFAHVTACADPVGDTGIGVVVGHVRCINRDLLKALDGPLQDAGDAVLVIAGTRGFGDDSELGDNPAGWGRSAVVQRLGVLSAIRLAPDCEPPPDDATVAVIVHHAVACAIGTPPNPPIERALVIKGDPIEPDGMLEVNLAVLRSDQSGEGMRTSK